MNQTLKDSITPETTRPSSISTTHDGEEAFPPLAPPFLVRTKTREEKENMRKQFKDQESRKDKGPYSWLSKYYAKVSTSFMLENKAATARDHLGTTFLLHICALLLNTDCTSFLANERTFLAWLRTSLSLITVGVGRF